VGVSAWECAAGDVLAVDLIDLIDGLMMVLLQLLQLGGPFLTRVQVVFLFVGSVGRESWFRPGL